MQDHLFNHAISSRAAADHLLRCNPPVGAVCNHVLLASQKDQVEELPETTQQELVVIASEEAGCSDKWMLVKFSEQDRNAIPLEEARRRIAMNQ